MRPGHPEERLVGGVRERRQLHAHPTTGPVSGLQDQAQLVTGVAGVDLGHQVLHPLHRLPGGPHHGVAGVDDAVGRRVGDDVLDRGAGARDHVVAQVLEGDHDRGLLRGVHELLVQLLVLLRRLPAVDLVGRDQLDVRGQLRLEPLEPVDPALADRDRGEQQLVAGREGLGALDAHRRLGRPGRCPARGRSRAVRRPGRRARRPPPARRGPRAPRASGRAASNGPAGAAADDPAGRRVRSPMSCPRWC